MSNKSFLSKLEIDTAQKAHNCKHSKKHRIQKGEQRLKVKEGFRVYYYCLGCAAVSVQKDSESLSILLTELRK